MKMLAARKPAAEVKNGSAKVPPVLLKRKPSVELKTAAELQKMRSAGRVVAEVLKILESAVKPGISTGELDRLAAEEIAARGATPAFLGYCGYPAVLCSSINEEVVHGIPDKKRLLREGDIVSLDMGAVCGGYYGDAAMTVPVGKISAEAARLLEVTKASLAAAIAAVRPGAFLGDVSSAVQSCAESAGMSVVRDFVGHGIGRHLHEEPAVPNYGEKGSGLRLEPGMTIAIEPMVNAGGWQVRVLDNGWTVVTKDESLSAHFEHTVAVTDSGAEILTV
ncbi:MAG: type I methionyl aminopeptidase [Elusimicrobiales bacterium]|nr:type I methionyl aminopeptidase [Elusimicrobiales bacterium]